MYQCVSVRTETSKKTVLVVLDQRRFEDQIDLSVSLCVYVSVCAIL